MGQAKRFAAIIILLLVAHSALFGSPDGWCTMGKEAVDPPARKLLPSHLPSRGDDVPGSKKVCMSEVLGSLPLHMVQNQGQLPEEVAFYIQGSDKDVYFTSQGVTIALKGRAAKEQAEGEEGKKMRWSVRLDFLGANPGVRPVGASMQKAVMSYFNGRPSDWKVRIPTYEKVVYPNLWSGIDLECSGDLHRLKYTFIVKPGADPTMIRMAYRGASDASISDEDTLEISTPVGSFEDGKPYAFQRLDNRKMEVPVKYTAKKEAATGAFTFGFDLGPYDANETLILDPEMLIYCGYIGGADGDGANDIAVDSQGHVYVTGLTDSLETSFPVKVGPDLSYNGGTDDAFVVKVDASGAFLVYCGYIGGDVGMDRGLAIDVDSQGNACVVGHTKSSEASFPVCVGPDLTHNGTDDGFIAKVDATGSSLLFCGYIGGIRMDCCCGVVLDSAGYAYTVGSTESSEYSFPVKTGPDLSYNGGTGMGWGDVFIAKVEPDGSDLVYCGYIGGSDEDNGYGIAVDKGGNAYVGGFTFSNASSFPVKVGPDLSHNGEIDGFVAKVNASGSDLVYCGYIGGWEREMPWDIAVDGQECAYLSGYTQSSEATFPVCIGPDLTYNGGMPQGYGDAFIAKVEASGASLVYCGYIGGKKDDAAEDIAVDAYGNAYCTGWTQSSENDGFPVALGPDLSYNDAGWRDCWVAMVNANGTFLNYCGYIGGNKTEYGDGLALDESGNVYIAGHTWSEEKSFPVKVGPDLTYNGSGPGIFDEGDAYLVKIAALSLVVDTDVISAALGKTVNLSLRAGPGNAHRSYLLLGSVSGTSPGTLLPGGQVVLPLNWDAFTNLVAVLINTASFQGFMDNLDSDGIGTAVFDTLGSLPPEAVGVTFSFAYGLNDPWDFASNPGVIEIVP